MIADIDKDLAGIETGLSPAIIARALEILQFQFVQHH